MYLWTYVSAYYHLYIIQARRSILSADVSETGVFVMYLFFKIFIAAEYSYKIKLMETWNDELNDKNSDAFKHLKNVLEEEVM